MDIMRKKRMRLKWLFYFSIALNAWLVTIVLTSLTIASLLFVLVLAVVGIVFAIREIRTTNDKFIIFAYTVALLMISWGLVVVVMTLAMMIFG